MSTITPNYTDVGTAVVTATTVANGSLVRGTIDLRAKFGGWLMMRVGWLGATAPGTQSPDVLVRRAINNDGVRHPGAVSSRVTSVANGTTITSIALNASSSVGATTLSTATAWTGILHGDVIYIGGNSGTPSNEEYARVSKISGTTLTVDAPLKLAHASGDTVVNKADAFPPVWLAGGSVYEAIFDYGANAAGSSARFEALITTYDSETST